MSLSNILHLVSTVFYVISTGALTITLGVLIWYAWETRGLRKETVKQTELNQRPCVVLDYEPGKVSYKNIGNSPAFNLKVEPLDLRDVHDKTLFILHFNQIYLLEPGALAEVTWEVEYINKDVETLFKKFEMEVDFPFFIGVLSLTEFPQVAEYDPMIIHYKNLDNAPYQTTIQPKVEEQEIEVASTGKVKK
jgi:hypothetical protein